MIISSAQLRNYMRLYQAINLKTQRKGHFTKNVTPSGFKIGP